MAWNWARCALVLASEMSGVTRLACTAWAGLTIISVVAAARTKAAIGRRKEGVRNAVLLGGRGGRRCRMASGTRRVKRPRTNVNRPCHIIFQIEIRFK